VTTAIAVGVFALTYALIATRRLALLPIGRPAGALLGAVLMVALGVLSPERALEAVDARTILLLFAMMLLSAYLERSGLFGRLARHAVTVCRGPRALLFAVAIVPGVLSAFLLNDAVCLFLALPIAELCKQRKLPFGPYLIALATSANIGSAATLVGNPQNMIVGSLSHLGFVEFMVAVGPASIAGLAINAALLFVFYGGVLPARFADAESSAPEPPADRLGLTLAVVLVVVVGLFAGLDLGFTVLAGVMILVLVDRREPSSALAKVDWSLLVFFACLFIVVAGLDSTGLVGAAWDAVKEELALDRASGLAALSALLTVGSNVVSNVPMVLLAGPHLAELGDPTRAWALVAFVTTVAGNLTLVGSVANLIVAERARDHYELGFFEYLRFGAVSTILVLGAGVPLVWLMT
jgi:Na+/H+ antiporter NhaD/arsenite permease-like protein